MKSKDIFIGLIGIFPLVGIIFLIGAVFSVYWNGDEVTRITFVWVVIFMLLWKINPLGRFMEKSSLSKLNQEKVEK